MFSSSVPPAVHSKVAVFRTPLHIFNPEDNNMYIKVILERSKAKIKAGNQPASLFHPFLNSLGTIAAAG